MSESLQEPQPQEPETETPQPQASKPLLPIATLVLRLITLASLTVSLSVMASNSTTLGYLGYRKLILRFNDVYAYRYMLSTAVLGMVYTLLQVPLALMQCLKLGRPMKNHGGFLYFDFYGDKVLLSLLATGVGAAFGVTLDPKDKLDNIFDDPSLQDDDVTNSLSPLRSKFDKFFNRAYISAAFLLIAFLCSVVSSVLSSLALSKRK